MECWSAGVPGSGGRKEDIVPSANAPVLQQFNSPELIKN
ncbi:hypothetical protein D1AOALGA4SA_4055 [Olavius algarvensis Delta 1 endosymbiont]|nr:hypothetical protein D1AOALGA4SA_4055 [Olavius algarvensis Delta 1 endosymbiont]